MDKPVISAKVIPVIEVTFCAGECTDENPGRSVKQYYSLDGKFLAEFDEFKAWKEQQMK